MFKKFFKSFLCTMLSVLMLASLASVSVSAAGITLSKTSATVTKGYSTTIKASGASDVSWSTGDKTIATVSSSGKVVGKGIGTTYIYAKSGSYTAKCKVTVVAGKIVAQSDVSMSTGDKTTIKIKALGTHSISAKSADKSIVKATWNGAKFNGNYIYLTLTAISSGSTTIKIYSKKYSDVYTTVNVTVDNGELDDDDDDSSPSTTTTTETGSIISLTDSVTVEAGKTSTAQFYSGLVNGYVCSVYNTSAATVTTDKASPATGTITISVKGLAAGTTVIKVVSKTDANKYITIPVTITAPTATYYVIADVVPTRILATDTILSVSVGNITKYMLVPVNYDSAYVSDAVAAALNRYEYYTVYSKSPTKTAASDLVQSFNITVNGTSTARYVLIPTNYDLVKYNTAIAKYNNSYDYYTIYNENPVVKRASTDEIRTWTVKDTDTQKTITRYILAPAGQSQSAYVQGLVDADLAAHAAYSYYTIYTASTIPTGIDYSVDTMFSWVGKDGTTKFMIYPLKNFDFIKRNDIVANDQGKYSYFNVYSTYPPVYDSTKEAVKTVTVVSGGATVNGYVLVLLNDTDYTKKFADASNGVYHYDLQTTK